MHTATTPASPLPIRPAKTKLGKLDAHTFCTYDDWFRAQVHEALNDSRPGIAHQHVMDEVQTLIDRKRRAHA